MVKTVGTFLFIGSCFFIVIKLAQRVLEPLSDPLAFRSWVFPGRLPIKQIRHHQKNVFMTEVVILACLWTFMIGLGFLADPKIRSFPAFLFASGFLLFFLATMLFALGNCFHIYWWKHSNLLVERSWMLLIRRAFSIVIFFLTLYSFAVVDQQIFYRLPSGRSLFVIVLIIALIVIQSLFVLSVRFIGIRHEIHSFHAQKHRIGAKRRLHFANWTVTCKSDRSFNIDDGIIIGGY